MPTYIKTGLWETLKTTAPKNWLNLTKLINDIVDSNYKPSILGSLKITDAAPTVQGLYILSDVGTYTNLGGLVTTAGKINYAYFDGTTWSLIAIDIPNGVVDNLTSTSITAALSANSGRILGIDTKDNFYNKLDLIPANENLLDKSKIEIGRWILSNGTIGTIGYGLGITNRIPIKNGQTLTISGGDLAQCYAGLYDKYENFISGTLTASQPSGSTSFSITNSLGYDCFAIFNVRNATINYMINVGSTALPYKAFSRQINPSYTSEFVSISKDFNPLFRTFGNLVDESKGYDGTVNSGNMPTTIYNVPVTHAAWYGWMSAPISVIPNKIYRVPTTGYYTTIAEYDINGNYISKIRTTNMSTHRVGTTTYYVIIEFVRDQTKGIWALEDYTSGKDVYTGTKILINKTVKKIKVPSVLYFLNDIDTYISKRQLFENYNEGKNYLKFTTTTNYKKSGKFKKTADFTEVIELYDGDLNMIDRKNVLMKNSSLVTNNGAINWLPIGDSYTDPAFWIKDLQNNTKPYFIPNVTSVGIKKGHSNNGGGDYNEGRSGWKLYSNSFSTGGYVNTIHSPNYVGSWKGYSPFLHVTGKKYFGCTGFWKEVMANTSHSHYEMAQKIGFNANGFKIGGVFSPLAVGDLMWDYDNSKYVEYNGSAWVNSTVVDADFTINFTIYRDVYGIAMPNITSVLLGINDFGVSFGDFDTIYTNYKSAMDLLITKAKVDNPSIKFIVCIPPISFGENGTEMTDLRNFAMSKLKNKLIEDYDGRTGENIYLSDLCNSLEDANFGDVSTVNYLTTSVQTSELKTSIIQNDIIHPNNSYVPLAKNMAAIIQAIR